MKNKVPTRYFSNCGQSIFPTENWVNYNTSIWREAINGNNKSQIYITLITSQFQCYEKILKQHIEKIHSLENINNTSGRNR